MAGNLRRLLRSHVALPGRLAAISLLFNLPFVLFRVHRMAYDTYIHIFLADHYWRSWWSLWEPRWYLGFSMASYPPLVHQLIALLARPLSGLISFFAPEAELYSGAFGFLGQEAAYVVVLLAVLIAFPLAVRAYARIFVGPPAAAWAGLAAVFLPGLSLTAWAFGQLPNLAGTTCLLWACARAGVYARGGDRWALAQAVTLVGTAAAAHHGAFLLLPFFALAMMGHDLALLLRSRGSLLSFGARITLWAGLSALLVATVLWPFFRWSSGQQMQAPIDHASRHNFIVDPLARRTFFWPVYGPLLAIALPAARMAKASSRWWALLGAFVLLFLLGLGGTTPLPRILFGTPWQWLTYERFAFWAAICLLPFAGAVLLRFYRRRPGWCVAVLGMSLLWATGAGWCSVIARSQPSAVDMLPIVRFLHEPEQRPYRYLTLGFGDQMAMLATITGNGTPDGDYHTARTLPELTTSGLAALDQAVWNPQGVWALAPFLSSPERYGVRWALVAHPAYVPVLRASGWHYRFQVGEVAAWESPILAAATRSAPPEDRPAAAWWGSVPLMALAAMSVTMLRSPLRALVRPGFSRLDAAHLLATLRQWMWTGTVLALALWWTHVLRRGSLPDVSLVYQGILIYASDILLSATLVVWGIERWLRREPLRGGPRSLAYPALGLIAACLLSTLWSQDKGRTLSFAMHLVLLAGWYLLCLNDPPCPAHIGRVLTLLLVSQSLVAAIEVAGQSTAGIQGLHLPWLGALSAVDSGAAVVGAAGGRPWLRAYGTLPHPNLLGGLLTVCLGVMLERYIASGRRPWLAAAVLGTVTLFLTFSRTAWGGTALIGVSLLLILRRAPLDATLRVRARRAMAAMGVTFVTLACIFWPIVMARLGGAPPSVTVETRSTAERVQLFRYGLRAIREHPLGLGAGTFVEWVYTLGNQPAVLEPVHNIPLLVMAETGIPGGLAGGALALAMGRRIWRRRKDAGLAEVVWAGITVGALAIGLLDHYWWTLAPMRTLLVMSIALWASEGAARGTSASGTVRR